MTISERRTAALRGPGAGGFTPPTSVAASNPCLNCGTNVQLSYCPECGQHEIDSDPTLREFVHELAEEFLHWDGKLATTFRTLVTRPGALTVEYLAGRRMRYVSPLRVYLTCSVLFFFLGAIAPKRFVLDRSGQRVERGIVQIGQATPKDIAAIDSQARASGVFMRVWLSHLARALREPERLQRTTLSAIPKGMFVLVPLFAALMGVMYRDRRRKYPQHLAFALHVHAALFLALTVLLGERFIQSVAGSTLYQMAILVPLAVYVVRAARTVYQGSTAQAFWRVSVACTMYFVAFVALLVLLFGLIVLSY